MKKFILLTAGSLLTIYVLICLLLYFFQERFIFFPEPLAPEHRFRFSNPFAEVFIQTTDKKRLHAPHFKAANPRGVIFYLHGNAGSLRSWGEEAAMYTALNYDVLMPDYRGYGKSEGVISSEARFYSDMQTAYNQLKEQYPEDKIVVLGYSIGTGPAAKLAADNHPRLLILQAPFYSLPDLMQLHYSYLPTFLLKYRFETYKRMKDCKMPVVLFHGTNDEIIPFQPSVRLKALLKEEDRLIPLTGGAHNGMSSHPTYRKEISRVLEQPGFHAASTDKK